MGRGSSGRVFGGFLVRRAFELAFATAYMYAGRAPVFREVDEVTFNEPVAVGNLLRLESAVLQTVRPMDDSDNSSSTAVSSSSSSSSSSSGSGSSAERRGSLVYVDVIARVVTAERAASLLSNSFKFCFEIPDNATAAGGAAGAGAATAAAVPLKLKRVLPASAEQAHRIACHMLDPFLHPKGSAQADAAAAKLKGGEGSRKQ
jgi:acyl-coenzyme A thioesterase 9